MIVITPGTPALCEAIIREAQKDIPILENPIGSNRSPEIDALCDEFGVPRGSSWCALWAAKKWKLGGAEIPPTSGDSHPAKCESWRKWAFRTNRFSVTPALGFAPLYDHNGDGLADHIGACVVSVKPILMDFEGNTSLTGFSREGELTGLKQIDTSQLIGYVSPIPLVKGVSA